MNWNRMLKNAVCLGSLVGIASGEEGVLARWDFGTEDAPSLQPAHVAAGLVVEGPMPNLDYAPWLSAPWPFEVKGSRIDNLPGAQSAGAVLMETPYRSAKARYPEDVEREFYWKITLKALPGRVLDVERISLDYSRVSTNRGYRLWYRTNKDWDHLVEIDSPEVGVYNRKAKRLEPPADFERRRMELQERNVEVIEFRWQTFGNQLAYDNIRLDGSVRPSGARPGPSAEPSEAHPSVQFDGRESYVTVPHAPELSLTGGGTIELWAYVEGFGNSLSPRLLSKSGGESSEGGWEVLLENAAAPTLQTGGNHVGRGGIPPGRWTHLAFTFEDGLWLMFLDGQAVGELRGAAIGEEDVDLRLGGHDGGGFHFRGRMREVRLWNHPRPASDIRADMRQSLTGRPKGLVAYWPMREGRGDVLRDHSGNGHHGVIHGADWKTNDALPDDWTALDIERQPPESSRGMRLLESGNFGPHLRGAQSITARGQQVEVLAGQNMNAAQGSADSLEVFVREAGDMEGWRRHEIYAMNERRVSMFANVSREHPPASPIFLTYTRRDKPNGAAVHRLDPDGSHRELFMYGEAQNGTGVNFLNSHGVLSPDGNRVDFIIPDRNGGGRMRWFQVDAHSGELLWHMPDREDFPKGTRVYDRVVDANGRVHVPIGTTDKTYMWWFEPETRTAGPLVEFDDTTGLGQPNETSRMFSIDLYPNKGPNGILLLTYLRPAEYSRRKLRGLVGQAVAVALDADTYEVLGREVIGGHTVEEAVSHYLNGSKIDGNHFALAYTTVAARNVFHQTRYHDNYVEGRLDVWRLNDDGSMEPVHRQPVMPSWHPNLTVTADGTLHNAYTETARHGRDALQYERWRVLTAPALRHISGGTRMNDGWHMTAYITGKGEPGVAYDQYVVEGDLALNGTLELVLGEDFTPSAGDRFRVLNVSGHLSGSFGQVDTLYGELPPGLRWDTSALSDQGMIQVVSD